jgi:hypothetical protein
MQFPLNTIYVYAIMVVSLVNLVNDELYKIIITTKIEALIPVPKLEGQVDKNPYFSEYSKSNFNNSNAFLSL